MQLMNLGHLSDYVMFNQVGWVVEYTIRCKSNDYCHRCFIDKRRQHAERYTSLSKNMLLTHHLARLYQPLRT
jgi:hypothetical protein